MHTSVPRIVNGTEDMTSVLITNGICNSNAILGSEVEIFSEMSLH